MGALNTQHPISVTVYRLQEPTVQPSSPYCRRPVSLCPSVHLPQATRQSSLTFCDPDVELLREPLLKELLIFLREPMSPPPVSRDGQRQSPSSRGPTGPPTGPCQAIGVWGKAGRWLGQPRRHTCWF